MYIASIKKLRKYSISYLEHFFVKLLFSFSLTLFGFDPVFFSFL